MTVKIYGFVAAGAIVLLMAFLIFNPNPPSTTYVQSYQTPSGQLTTITKACTAPLVQVGNSCQQSTNTSPTTIPLANSTTSGCANGGTRLNGICPESVVTVPSNITKSIQTTTPTPPPVPSTENIQIIP